MKRGFYQKLNHKIMKKKISSLLTIGLFILFSSFSFPTNNNWSEAYNNDNLIIYTRTTSDGFKEFKAITTMNVKMNTVLAIMKDYKRHPEWMRVLKSCKMIEEESSTSRYLHYSIAFPWPLWDRDIISKSSFAVNEDGSVNLNIKSSPEKKEETKGEVRIKSASGFWNVQDLKNGKTKIIYQYKADPVGLPTSLVNMYVLEGPKETFHGLKEQVKLAEYENPNMDWLYK